MRSVDRRGAGGENRVAAGHGGGGGVVIRPGVLNDPRWGSLSASAKLLFLALCVRAGAGDRTCAVSLGKLGSDVGGSESTVLRALKALEGEGWIERRSGRGRFCPTTYRINTPTSEGIEDFNTPANDGIEDFNTPTSDGSIPPPVTDKQSKETDRSAAPSGRRAKSIRARKPDDRADGVRAVVDHMNDRWGTRYSASAKETRKLICARLAEGYSGTDCRRVVDHKTHEWTGDPRMKTYLRPSTLFRPTHFSEYLEGARQCATCNPTARKARAGNPWTEGPAERGTGGGE